MSTIEDESIPVSTYEEAEAAIKSRDGFFSMRRSCWPVNRYVYNYRTGWLGKDGLEKCYFNLHKETGEYEEYEPEPEDLKATDWLIEK